MIITIKTMLLRGAYALNKWGAIFEVDADSLLQDIHMLFQDALNFDNDHMYDFYIA